MKKILLLFFCVLLFSVTVNAATIYGTVYDLSLNKVENAIVEINTQPHQRVVAINGSYQFEVPLGKYLILGTYEKDSVNMKARENFTVVDDGLYVIDLFLYPDFDEGIYEDINFEIDAPYSDYDKNSMWLLIPLISIMFLFLIALIKINTRLIKKEIEQEIKILDDDLNKIVKLLKENDGRMRQKDIRKKITLSEAKISLMISELEALGIIKKIKRGRGNIVVLKNK